MVFQSKTYLLSRLFLTGATGNLGKACYDYFLQKNFEIVAWFGRETADLSRRPFPPVPEGSYDLAILAHGAQEVRKLAEWTPEEWDRFRNVNLDSCFYLARELIPRMEPGGLIVFCSSIQAQAPREGRVAYAICKAGLEALAKAIVQEGHCRAIALRLGHFSSPMRNIPAYYLHKIRQRQPLGLIDVKTIPPLIETLWTQASYVDPVLDLTGGQLYHVW